MGEASGFTPDTVKAYTGHLSDFVRFVNDLGATMPEDITEDHIVAYILHKKKTCNGVSVATYYNHARAWLNWMTRRGIIKISPCAALKNPTIPKTIIRPLTSEQVQRMVGCCTDYRVGMRDKAIILLIYDSGLRRSEVSSIRLEDLDLKKGSIKVMGKGSKERLVGMGEAAKGALMQYLLKREDTQPWVFVTYYKGRPSKITPCSITCMVKRTMQRAGITGVKMGPHTLRHSFATASIQNGANLFYVQALLGHSDLDMTRRYAAMVNSEEAVKQHHSFSPADRINKGRG